MTMKLENTKSEISHLNSQFEHQESQKIAFLEKAKKSEEDQAKKISELKSVNNKLKVDVKALTKKLKETTENSGQKAELTNKLLAEIDSDKQEIQEKSVLLSTLQKNFDAMKSSMDNEITKMTQEHEKYQNEICDLKSIIEDFQQSHKASEINIKSKEENISHLSNQLSSARGELQGND